MAKLSANHRALLLANLFNLLAAIYFIIIAIVALVQLRWYHQLTVTVRLRHLVTSATSYFAFLLLIFVALVLMATFVVSTLQVNKRQQETKLLSIHRRRRRQQQISEQTATTATTTTTRLGPINGEQLERETEREEYAPNEAEHHQHHKRRASSFFGSQASTCCSSLIYLIAAIGLIVILVIWLVNTGELVRESIMTQLEMAYHRYQFSNRSNHYSVAIDAMQDTNNCCGSLDYTDFPRQRWTGLSSGFYPGSCCGKNIFGVNARVLCTPEEVWRAKQTTGCTTVLAHYYELVSLLVVPVALVCLFVNISILALVTIARGATTLAAPGENHTAAHGPDGGGAAAAEQAVHEPAFYPASSKLHVKQRGAAIGQ